MLRRACDGRPPSHVLEASRRRASRSHRRPGSAPLTLLYQHAARMTGEDMSPRNGETDPSARHHRDLLRVPRVAGPRRTIRNQHAARVCAPTHDLDLALRAGVESPGRDRDTGVRLESLPALPVDHRLRLHGVELVRDTASEPVPGGVARPARIDVAAAGQVADPVRPLEVRVAELGARVPAGSPLVLTTKGDR